jgi:hypothetical protein
MSSRGAKGSVASAARARARARETLIRGSKRCNGCGRDLPLAAYPPRPEVLDGRKGCCCECETLRLHHRYMGEAQARKAAALWALRRRADERALVAETVAFLETDWPCCTPSWSDGQWQHDRACVARNVRPPARKVKAGL